MELRTLKYFVTVAEELNITKAAEKLNMSQPPLSAQMKSLEEELDTVLFIRGKRQLQLTESGKLLYRRANEIISLSKKAGEEIGSMGKGMTGTISIGVVQGMAPGIVASWIAGFRKEYPNVRFRLLDGNSDDLTEKLRSGLISLAVISAPYDQLLLNSFPVGSEQYRAYMSKDHPLASQPGTASDSNTTSGKITKSGSFSNPATPGISIEDLKDQPLIVSGRRATIDTLYRWFREIGSEPNIICEMESYPDAIALARENVGICIYPECDFVTQALIPVKPGRSDSSRYPKQGDIAIRTIKGPNRSLDYLFVWLKGHPLPIIEEAFIDYAKANRE